MQIFSLSLFGRAYCKANAIVMTSICLFGILNAALALTPGELNQLKAGQVLIKQNVPEAKGAVPSVEAQILVSRPQEKTWTVVSNPEVLLKEESKVKRVKVLSREGNVQHVAFSVVMTPLFPAFNYVLLQRLTAPSLITFHRESGSFREVQGAWRLSAVENGNKTILSYTLKLDPGPLIPHALLLAAVKSDLPNFMKHAKLAIEKQAL